MGEAALSKHLEKREGDGGGQKGKRSGEEKIVRGRERGGMSRTVCPDWPRKGENRDKVQRASPSQNDSDKPIEKKGEEGRGEISDEPDSMSRLAPGVVNYDNTHTKTTTTINIEEMKK